MESRYLFAYILIALLILAAAMGIFYSQYQRADRKATRQYKRDRERHRAKVSDKIN